MTGAAGPDRFDRAILAILQRDGTTPQRAIGEAVGLSAPAVQQRIGRLVASGVIQSVSAVLDPPRSANPSRWWSASRWKASGCTLPTR